jgi:hypothetical protein
VGSDLLTFHLMRLVFFLFAVAVYEMTLSFGVRCWCCVLVLDFCMDLNFDLDLGFKWVKLKLASM